MDIARSNALDRSNAGRDRFVPGAFPLSSDREKAPSICFDAIADVKPLRTFAGITLQQVALIRIHATCCSLLFAHVFFAKPLHTFARHALAHSPCAGPSTTCPATAHAPPQFFIQSSCVNVDCFNQL
jgi:hypothetical protein